MPKYADIKPFRWDQQKTRRPCDHCHEEADCLYDLYADRCFCSTECRDAWIVGERRVDALRAAK